MFVLKESKKTCSPPKIKMNTGRKRAFWARISFSLDSVLGCILIFGGWCRSQKLRKLIVQILLQLFHMISTNHSISGTFLVEPWDPSRRSRIAFLQETLFSRNPSKLQVELVFFHVFCINWLLSLKHPLLQNQVALPHSLQQQQQQQQQQNARFRLGLEVGDVGVPRGPKLSLSWPCTYRRFVFSMFFWRGELFLEHLGRRKKDSEFTLPGFQSPATSISLTRTSRTKPLFCHDWILVWGGRSKNESASLPQKMLGFPNRIFSGRLEAGEQKL